MVAGTSEEPRGGPGVAVNPAEAVQDAVPPVHGRAGTDRVRRPADLLLAVFAFVVVAVVLGSIRALPLGSTEVADDVSGWLLHIPRWLAYAAAVVAGVASFVLVVVSLVVLVRDQWRDALNAVVAGLVGASAAVIATVIWRIENATVERAVLHGSNPSIFIVDTAFVAFVVGTDLSRLSHWQRWWPRAGAALLLSGLAVGTLTPFAVVIVASGGLLVGWVVRWLLGAASVLPGVGEAHRLADQPARPGHGPVGRRTKPRAAGGEAGRRHPDPRSPVRPRHPRIGPGPSAVGAGPPPAGGRGAHRAQFPRPGPAARPGLLPGAASRRAQSRGPAAGRDAR